MQVWNIGIFLQMDECICSVAFSSYSVSQYQFLPVVVLYVCMCSTLYQISLSQFLLLYHVPGLGLSFEVWISNQSPAWGAGKTQFPIDTVWIL